ncbi:protein RarD [Paraphotobacterium marinum]|uniref:Protein RarD n=1 Tax=Paraphotobacterium marinum TaxID=1755811 RepID=A0A220VF67_9GAMM|nr:EamA family transporter RarD [Paraphotobacterium marinum]ASK78989.1 protein RarD [Paraphotobacterium marinum]
MKLNNTTIGVINISLAYTLWGLGPLFYKFLEHLPTFEIVSFRVVWSLFFLLVIILMSKKINTIKSIIYNKENIKFLSITSILIFVNWFTYIWAIKNNHVLDASLGYFINPIFFIFLSMFFLKERLNKFQIIAVTTVILAVLYQVLKLGSVPWVAIILTVSFGFYALLKKQSTIDSQAGLLFENILLFPLTFGYLLFVDSQPSATMIHNSIILNVFIVLSGVMTTLPLIFFNRATTKLNLSTIGFFQYINPTISFFTGIFLFHESFNYDQFITFSLIWAALAVISFDSIWRLRKAHQLMSVSCKPCNQQ